MGETVPRERQPSCSRLSVLGTGLALTARSLSLDWARPTRHSRAYVCVKDVNWTVPDIAQWKRI